MPWLTFTYVYTCVITIRSKSRLSPAFQKFFVSLSSQYSSHPPTRVMFLCLYYHWLLFPVVECYRNVTAPCVLSDLLCWGCEIHPCCCVYVVYPLYCSVKYSVEWIGHNLYIHSPISRHLVLSLFSNSALAEASVNLLICVFGKHMHLFPLGDKAQGKTVLGHRLGICLA